VTPAAGAGPPRATLRALLLDPRAQGPLLVACAALILFARAGAGPLPNYDDAYYAEKAKQMLRTGDWLTPRFAGFERLDNPPLFLWLMAASFAVMGVSSFAAVFWSALAGVACVALVHRLALRLGRDPFEAWAAGFVLLGTGYFLKYANHAMFDVFLSALFLFAMLAYRRAWEGSAAAWAAVGALAGLGVLTKSALGLFPLLVAGAHVLACGRLARALRDGAWLAPIAGALVVAPWYGHQLAVNREAFLSEHVAWLLVERGTGAGAGPPALDPLGYPRELALSYWPWLPLALAGLALTWREAWSPAPAGEAATPKARAWGRRESALLLLAWLVVVLGVMSFAREKKLWYVMSIFPALSLVSARALAAWARAAALRERLVPGGFAVAVVAGAVLALTPWGSAPVRRPDLQQVALASRAIVPAGETIAFLGGNYFSVAHQFVFYSDRTLTRGPEDPAAVRDTLEAGGWALLSRVALSRVTEADPERYVPVVASGDWTLVHRAPAPRVTLEPRATSP
jgi:4-amino-4-deoxy-L-arabinose transferase-like glycosyltransferase